MLKFLLPAIVLVFALSTAPAFANHCPIDMKKIDEAMTSAKLSDADMAKVKALRAEGETLHKAGNHEKSVEVLGEAMKILGVK
jgi:hypothetical protein